ncbi:restriction endonuclease subunit S [Micrococcus sp. 2A]|uniref:restriction endonuclease subunit S n=1 Tax=Micrococcus sp. 2A TaxID=3142261 RepID=UPI0031BA54BF
MREGWREFALGDLFETTNKRLGAHREEPEVFSVTKSDGFVPAADYFGKRVASAKLDTYKVVEPDEWAYSTIHIDEGSIARNRLGRTGVVSPMYTTMRLRGGRLDPYLAELVLRSPEMLATYGDAQQGSINRRRSLPWKSFETLMVNLPPLEEQRRIVDLMTAVDDAFESTTQLADTAEVLWWELTRDLETACDGLDLKPLGDISDIHGGLTKNKNDALRPDVLEAPYLRVANVYRRYLNLDEVSTIVASQKRIEGAILQPGDLLMNEGGDRDKLGRGTVWRGQIDGCTHQNHVFRVRVTDAEFVPEFVSAWANSYGKKWFDINASQTTGIASISKTTLSKFPVPVLPYADQERWADLLDTLTTHEWELRVQLKNLRDLRSNLLTALLSGEHEIPDAYDEIMEVSS